MSKGLKALQEMQRQVGNIHYFDFSDDLPRQTNIELRESGLFEIIEKELKVLEIIKIKKFIDFNVYEMQGKYYLTTGNNYRGQIPISKREYDLLKEVLL